MARVNVKVVSKNPKYKQYENRVQKKFQDAVSKSVYGVLKTVIQGISEQGQGEVYEKYNPRRTHTASADGAYPATDTGYLKGHINAKIYSDGMGGEIQSNAEYSSFLEFGTSTMSARPFMQPSLEENRNRIKQLFKDIK